MQLRPTASTVEVFQLVGEEARRRGDDGGGGATSSSGWPGPRGRAAAVAIGGSRGGGGGGGYREVLSRRLERPASGEIRGWGAGPSANSPTTRGGAARIIQGDHGANHGRRAAEIPTPRRTSSYGILAHGEPWLRDALTEARGG